MYYSLSDQVGVECKKDENHILAGNEFKLLTEKWNRICRDITYKNNDFFSPKSFSLNWNTILMAICHSFLTVYPV